MQNNCNSLIPWKTFFDEKNLTVLSPKQEKLGFGHARGWRGSARLEPEWLLGILDSGHLSSSSSTFRRRRRQKREKEGKLRWGRRVCRVFTVRINFVRIRAVPARLQRRDATESPAHPLTPSSHVPARSSIAHASPLPRLTSCQFPVGMWVPALRRSKAPEKSKCYKRCKNPFQRAPPMVPLTYCVWYHSSVWLQRVRCGLWGARGPSAPEICRNAPFV